jgi:GTPase
MASIFTFDPNPPRVSSPWLAPENSTTTPPGPKRSEGSRSRLGTPPLGLLADYNVTKLDPEPQTGPVEFKLHLLLRPRRTYSSSSTGTYITGSQQSKKQARDSGSVHAQSVMPAHSNQSRQNRLQQLTTQLLWRLQQSSPYHSSSTRDLVLPKLPEVTALKLETPPRPGKLLAGLEESRGALYEIGVSDDGTFVGLTGDEMEESLNNLRAMAASLGCSVEVTRMVAVGDCEWYQQQSELEEPINNSQDGDSVGKQAVGPALMLRHQEQLWVAEALVTPDISSKRPSAGVSSLEDSSSAAASVAVEQTSLADVALFQDKLMQQLRVTLTGPTTSGKSSLLGTLSTATLDNGRGKSRLSLLKHRHELASGVTSSVAQELLGYKRSTSPGTSADVINYATGNVASWNDIHASSEGGRLVLVSDSAGHPRYRRTTVRGLVGWAPHWTMLCVAADDGDNASTGAGGTSSAQDVLGIAGAGINLSSAHLELCLKLEKPLVIVITKLDLASRLGLRQTLSKILSAIKSAGRVPAMLPPDQTKIILDSDLESISQADADAVRKIVDTIDINDLKSVVPIVMTSAAKGIGVRMMHALLHSLPIPATPTSMDYVGAALNPEQPACLFHIEDIFDLPAAYSKEAKGIQADSGTVVGGYLRFGSLSVGDNIVVGPFPVDGDAFLDNSDSDRCDTQTPPLGSMSKPSPGGRVSGSPDLGRFTRSNPSASELARIASRNAASASVAVGEWHNAHIVSIRNLRLPVHKLGTGQVGTIGMVFDLPEEEVSDGPFEKPPPQVPRIRKGMVLAIPSHHMIQTGHTLQAASGFTASFEDGDVNSVTPGSLVVVYIASIRSPARVVRLVPHTSTNGALQPVESGDDIFGLDDTSDKDEESDPPIFGVDGVTDVTLELITNREWIELGSQLLIMPGGGHGLYHGSERGEKGVAGLEGFVGKIIEVVD